MMRETEIAWPRYQEMVSRSKGHTKYWNKFIKEYKRAGNKPFTLRDIRFETKGARLNYSEWMITRLKQENVIIRTGEPMKFVFSEIKEVHHGMLFHAMVTFTFSQHFYDHLRHDQKIDYSDEGFINVEVENGQTPSEGKPAFVGQMLIVLSKYLNSPDDRANLELMQDMVDKEIEDNGYNG